VLALLSPLVLRAIPIASASPLALEGPPPTPVPPNASPSPFIQSLDTPKTTAKPPKIQASEVILVNLATGQVLLEKAAEKRRPIASLTKVMTALVVLEEAELHDVVKISELAARTANIAGLSSAGLEPGEKITVEDLLWSLMLQSANDAAVALAEHVSGSVPSFLKLMDRRAKQLGMDDTHFASPNGLNDRGYSSAHDLALVTAVASADPFFAKMTRTKFHTVPGPPGGTPRRIQNRNALLWLYPGTTGAKTGYTSAAGYNVIATAERDGRSLIAIVLGAPGEAFSGAATLLNYGFEEFDEVTIIEAGERVGSRDIDGASVALMAAQNINALIPPKTKESAIKTKVILASDAIATVGAEVGEAQAVLEGDVLGSSPLVVASVATPSSGGDLETMAGLASTTVRAGLDSVAVVVVVVALAVNGASA